MNISDKASTKLLFAQAKTSLHFIETSFPFLTILNRHEEKNPFVKNAETIPAFQLQHNYFKGAELGKKE